MGFSDLFETKNSSLASTLLAFLDDFHSPITPAQYLETRVKTLIFFYQGRLRPYSRMRTLFETLLIASSLASSTSTSLCTSARTWPKRSGKLGSRQPWQMRRAAIGILPQTTMRTTGLAAADGRRSHPRDRL